MYGLLGVSGSIGWNIGCSPADTSGSPENPRSSVGLVLGGRLSQSCDDEDGVSITTCYLLKQRRSCPILKDTHEEDDPR